MAQKQCSKFFRMFDFFQSSKLLRYNGDAEYKSTSGGIVTIFVIGVLIALFFSMGLRTVRKEIISSSIETRNLLKPSPVTLRFGAQDQMMFVLNVAGLNLSATPRLFDFQVGELTHRNEYFLSKKTIVMEPCTQAHLNFSSDLQKSAKRVSRFLSASLCPRMDQNFTLQGWPCSKTFNSISVNVTRCNPALDPTCANDTVYSGIEAAKESFQISIFFIDQNINPGSQEYKTLFLNDRNSFYFNSRLGTEAYAELASNIVQTDASLMPYEEIEEQIVPEISKKFSSSHYMTTINSRLFSFKLVKSPTLTIYKRSFNKVDSYFSYVGGLVGTVISLIFIMNFYTEKAYEVSIARKVLLDNNGEEISSSSFNIFYYFTMILKGIFSKCKFEPKWPRTDTYHECCKEISMQLDVTYIVKKLMFFDDALSKLLEKDELEELYLRGKPTIAEAKKKRRKYYTLQIFKMLQGDREGECKEEEGEKGQKDEKEIAFKGKELGEGVYNIPVNFQGNESELSEVIGFIDEPEKLPQRKKRIVRQVSQFDQFEGVGQKSIEDRSEESRMENDSNIIIKPAKRKDENEDRFVLKKERVVKGLKITSMQA